LTKHQVEPKPSKVIKKLVKKEIDETGAKPDPSQDIDQVLNQTDEDLNKETETPEHKEERKQELRDRRMQSTGKRAIYYPKGYD